MSRWAALALSALLWSLGGAEGRAQWGWPPPGYSVSGMRACDGYRYRGLLQVLRDRRCGVCDCGIPSLVEPNWAPAPPVAIRQKAEAVQEPTLDRK